MSKNKKLYNLRLNISSDAERIECLLDNAVYKADTEREVSILCGLALELVSRISKNSEKIGIILHH